METGNHISVPKLSFAAQDFGKEIILSIPHETPQILPLHPRSEIPDDYPHTLTNTNGQSIHTVSGHVSG